MFWLVLNADLILLKREYMFKMLTFYDDVFFCNVNVITLGKCDNISVSKTSGAQSQVLKSQSKFILGL